MLVDHWNNVQECDANAADNWYAVWFIINNTPLCVNNIKNIFLPAAVILNKIKLR